MKKRVIALFLATTVLLTGCSKNVDENTESIADSTASASVEEIVEVEPVIEEPAPGTELIVDTVNWNSSVSVPSDNQSVVFYEIFVGSFSDSDGDGCGDLRGIINRFDYLNDGDDKSGKSLGVEGIWLSPIFKSPSYHKYDVTNYYEIDSKFGTMDDLKELVELCHERGVKLILDMVINHTSSSNLWFQKFTSAHKEDNKESEYYDFYTYADTGKGTGRVFYMIPGDDEYYEGNFSSDMPELNYDNEMVRETVIEIARYYLEDIGVDGFRFDAAKYIYYGEQEKNVDFWVWYIDELKKIKPDVYTVAEVWDADSMTDKYEVALNCFDFTMSQAEGKISATSKKGDVNLYTSYVESYINRVKGYNESATIIPFIANHDMDRTAGFCNVTNGTAFVAANLYLLGPGSPFIYYGEEIGMKGSRGSDNTDANRRLAMLWGDDDTVKNPTGSTYPSDKQTNGTVFEQLSNKDSLFNYYKKLIMIRKANPEIYLGEYKALAFADTKVGGFTATYEGSNVCVIHNTSASEQTIDLASATDLTFTEINAVMGSYIDNTPSASLDGTKLTIAAQTSAVLR